MRTETKSDIPPGSENTPVNVCGPGPEPEVGESDTIVGGPPETTRFTEEPEFTEVPATGLSLITLPAATVLDAVVTVPNTRPAPVMALVAAACVSPTTLGTVIGAAGDQVPFNTKPVFAVFPFAYRYTFCVPVKVPLKLRFTLHVRLLPDVLKEEPVPFNVHWLFDTVPAEPGATAGDKNAVPALLYKYI